MLLIRCIYFGLVVTVNAGRLSELPKPKSYIMEENKQRCFRKNSFRMVNGMCNNLNEASWGVTNEPFLRFKELSHSDLRNPAEKELPNARNLSVNLFPPEKYQHATLNLYASFFGQVITHDASSNLKNENGTKCCNGKYPLPNDSCMPIVVPEEDEWYSMFNKKCIEFSKAVTKPEYETPEQVNKVSSFIDTSFIYGTTDATAHSLRRFEGGLLASTSNGGREFMMASPNRKLCAVQSESEPCYKSGDPSVNMHLSLVAQQTLLLRMHNGMAVELRKLNPTWTDEKLYQEARMVVIGAWQHIIYQEWLPNFIGTDITTKIFGNADKCGYTSIYSDRIKPGIFNEFSIAFRAFHSLIPTDLWLMDENRQIVKKILFSDQMQRPAEIEANEHSFDDLLRGIVTQPMPKLDEYITPEVTSRLFKLTKMPGDDLLSIDIQRGRDHGVPTYNDMRKHCGLSQMRNVDDLSKIFGENGARKLLNSYTNFDDIELLVGILYELHSPALEVGPVLYCIFSTQFYRLAVSDRYFYTNRINNKNRFSSKQLRQIKKASLAYLICEFSDNIQMIQRQAFRLISDKNPLVCCKNIPRIDLNPWVEDNM